MFDQLPTDVLKMSHHLVPWTSSNWVPQTSRGRPRSELLNICSSCKKQKQICNGRTITSEKQFFQKIINFCVGPLRVPWVSLVGSMLGPLGNLQGRPWVDVCRLGVSYDNLLDCNVYHPKIVANHGSFIHLKYSLTDLIIQHLQEKNPLFYDLWSIYHPRALSGNSNKKLILLVFFKKCKF